MLPLLSNIGFFYLALFVPIAIWTTKCRDVQLHAAVAMFGALIWAAWNPDLWDSPAQMAVFHMLVLVVFAAFVKYRMVELLFMMVVFDVIWMVMGELPASTWWYQFPTHDIWWQSCINLTFVAMLYFTGRACYTTHQNRSTPSRNKKHDGFSQRSSHDLSGFGKI